MSIDTTTSMALSRVKGTNRAIVAMGYDSTESNIILSKGDGDKLPDPLTSGSYDLVWWNASDYLNPANDPNVEIVKCIAKVGDTVIVMRSQDGPAYDKNIMGKTYGIAPIPINNSNEISSSISSLSYYNLPQTHGSTYHDSSVETSSGSQSKVDTHAGLTTAHSSTSAATASKIMQRDASGNAKVAAPAAADDIAIRSTVDTVQTNLNNHATAVTGIHGVGASNVESIAGSTAKVTAHNTTTSVHNFDASGNAPALTHDNTRHSATYVVQSAVDSTVSTHAGYTTGIHGVGGSTVESVSGSTSKVSTHAGIGTGIHGVTGTILGSEKIGVVSGIAGLDASGKVPTSQLPGMALTNVYTAANQAAQLALNATTQEGDVAIRTDGYGSYVRNSGVAGTMADWSSLLAPTDVVTSVFGRTGVVSAATNDYTWAMINKATSDIADITTRSHGSLTDGAIGGGKTHAQIDTHINATGTSVHGLGTMSTQNSTGVSITAGTITGITDLTVADGGTGASDAATARTNLGLGSISTQASNSVSITGGQITGITDLTVADGGTGAGTLTGVLIGNGTSAITGTSIPLGSNYGGTGNGFTKFTGATTSEKTYTLPDASATIEYQANKNATSGYAGLSSGQHSITLFPISSKGTSYAATASDYTIVCTAAITITIPAAGTAGAGKVYNIKSNVAGTIAITSSSNIDAALTYNMYARYETVCIQSDGTQWWVV